MKPRITRVPPLSSATDWRLAVDGLMRAVNVALADVADALEGKGASRAFLDDVFDADAAFPRYLPNPLRTRPAGVSIVFAEDLTNGATFTNAVFPTWAMTSDGRIAVRGLSGLVAGHRYRLRYEVSA